MMVVVPKGDYVAVTARISLSHVNVGLWKLLH